MRLLLDHEIRAGDAKGKASARGLPLENSFTDLSAAVTWLGQDEFAAVLLDDGRIQRFGDKATTSSRYSQASVNSRGEVVVVPRSSLSFSLPPCRRTQAVLLSSHRLLRRFPPTLSFPFRTLRRHGPGQTRTPILPVVVFRGGARLLDLLWCRTLPHPRVSVRSRLLHRRQPVRSTRRSPRVGVLVKARPPPRRPVRRTPRVERVGRRVPLGRADGKRPGLPLRFGRTRSMRWIGRWVRTDARRDARGARRDGGGRQRDRAGVCVWREHSRPDAARTSLGRWLEYAHLVSSSPPARR